MKETHITEFTAKRGSGLHVRVCTTRGKRKISVDGGRFYYSDYSSKKACLRAAKESRDAILLDLELNPAARSKSATVDDLFQASFSLIPVALSTRESYEGVYDAALQELKTVPIREVTLQQVQLSLNSYSASHTQNRVNLLMNVWHRIYRTAMYMQIPVVDYSQMITAVRSRVPVRRKVKETDYKTFQIFLAELARSDAYFAPVVRDVSIIMYWTGMRVQEVLGLMQGDIDFGAGVIRVQRSVGSDRFKKGVIVPLKTDQSVRTLPLPPQLVPVFDRLIAEAETELLFTDPYDNPINVKQLSMLVTNVSKRAGIQFNLYALRHLFSADLFRQNVNPKIIQSLMGHATADMSAYYAFTNEDERTEAVLNRKPS